jgi:hypothetical protein
MPDERDIPRDMAWPKTGIDWPGNAPDASFAAASAG